MHPSVIDGYVAQMAHIVRPGGFVWLDHSGRGARASGHRTAMTAELMVDFAEKAGLHVESQEFRNGWDCISVLRRPVAAVNGDG